MPTSTVFCLFLLLCDQKAIPSKKKNLNIEKCKECIKGHIYVQIYTYVYFSKLSISFFEED